MDQKLLSERTQFLSFNNNNSNVLPISCGVPQGTILGPILFILYINDLCDVSKCIKFILFADDTNLLCTANNIEKLQDTMN